MYTVQKITKRSRQRWKTTQTDPEPGNDDDPEMEEVEEAVTTEEASMADDNAEETTAPSNASAPQTDEVSVSQ